METNSITNGEEERKKDEFDPVFDASAHTVVSLMDVLEGNSDSIAQLKLEFEQRGWCIIKLPTQPQNVSFLSKIFSPPIDYPKLLKFDHGKLTTFFSTPKRIGLSGYQAVAHKETIHLLTPPDENFLEPTLSSRSRGDMEAMGIKGMITGWVEVLDRLSLELVAQIAKPIFGCTKEELQKKAKMPVSISDHRGMLDIVLYMNKKTATLSPNVGHSTEDVNCVPHYDPGLLSISFFSNCDGLQLQDPNTKIWFAGPVNTQKGQEEYGVIWLGEVAVQASEGKLKAGVHRAVYPREALPRITAWYELCTIEQANYDIKQNFPFADTIKPRNIMDAKPFTFIKKGMSMLEKRIAMEEHYGISSTKPLYAEPREQKNTLYYH